MFADAFVFYFAMIFFTPIDDGAAFRADVRFRYVAVAMPLRALLPVDVLSSMLIITMLR